MQDTDRKLMMLNFEELGKEVIRSPRNFKVDIFTIDVSSISIEKVYDAAREVWLRNDKIKVAALEVLLVAKLRAMTPSSVVYLLPRSMVYVT
jgi:predicted rRNA methylase YqxC with S4 and FtsJ domains